MNILLIGCGNVGGALLRQWLYNIRYRFTIASPTATGLPVGMKHVTKATQLSLAEFDMMLIAFKPQKIADVLPEYAFSLKLQGCFASIAAGCSIDQISGIVEEKAIVRIMLNLAAMVGLGVSGLYANAKCTEQQKTEVTKLIAETDKCILLSSEDEIDRLTAISGSGPSYIFEVMRSYVLGSQVYWV